MGFLMFLIGIATLVTAVVIAALYFAAMVALVVFAVSWLVCFLALLSLLGGQQALSAALLALPLAALCFAGVGKWMDK